MSISIRNSTLLYRPSLSIWTARKLDKNESQRVAQTNGAVDGAANVHKALLPNCPELQAIQKWAGGFRDFVYTRTLPWDDGGWRVGKALAHLQFMSDLSDRITCGRALCEDFYAVYDKRVAEARFELSHLFNPSDYPTLAQVKARFNFQIEVMPLPNTDDFRVVDGLPQEEANVLVGKATSAVEQRIDAAMQDAYARLHLVVSKMANTLGAYDRNEIKKFNDTLVTNISEVVELMPSLNLTNDPKLADLTDRARKLTAIYNCADLRKFPDDRQQAIGDALSLAHMIAGVASAPSREAAQDRLAAMTDARALFADMLS